MHRLSYTLVTALLTTAGLVPIALAAPAAAAPRPAVAAGHPTDHPHAEPGLAITGRDEVEVISVRGAGPFRIGADLARLSAAGLIDWVAPDCDGTVHTGVTGAWAGKILLTFLDGRLVGVGTATAPPRTPAGASVGMSFAALEEIYGPRGSMIRNDAGDASAYLVRVGSRVELFTGHPIRPGVGYLQVGPASVVERGFREGRSC
ncbi:hypothetical protein DER29_0141 [Micromonospora sp. M71_S20]|uniref:hypothetical protein n=1 Tax=Micromonospora sp. M71_S20 TaxID=592872 RepID=UPI000EB3EB5C|nr:hypothetical protein [Micromonospora sp. M71_S20]RLK22309.1 hypothetical protein DER29_0141 [Micromonospora sp. M71_S20]